MGGKGAHREHPGGGAPLLGLPGGGARGHGRPGEGARWPRLRREPRGRGAAAGGGEAARSGAEGSGGERRGSAAPAAARPLPARPDPTRPPPAGEYRPRPRLSRGKGPERAPGVPVSVGEAVGAPGCSRHPEPLRASPGQKLGAGPDFSHH